MNNKIIFVVSSARSGGRVIAHLLSEMGVNRGDHGTETWESGNMMQFFHKNLIYYYRDLPWGTIKQNWDEALTKAKLTERPFFVKDSRTLQMLPFFKHYYPNETYIYIKRDRFDWATGQYVHENPHFALKVWEKENHPFVSALCTLTVSLEGIAEHPDYWTEVIANHIGYQGGPIDNTWIIKPQTIGRGRQFKEEIWGGKIKGSCATPP